MDHELTTVTVYKPVICYVKVVDMNGGNRRLG